MTYGSIAAQCAGKERFDSAKVAYAVASRRGRATWKRQPILGEPYRCSVCGFWHIGSKQPSVRAQKRRKFIEESRA